MPLTAGRPLCYVPYNPFSTSHSKWPLLRGKWDYVIPSWRSSRGFPSTWIKSELLPITLLSDFTLTGPCTQAVSCLFIDLKPAKHLPASVTSHLHLLFSMPAKLCLQMLDKASRSSCQIDVTSSRKLSMTVAARGVHPRHPSSRSLLYLLCSPYRAMTLFCLRIS